MKISVFYDHIKEAAEQTQRPVAEILRKVRDAGITGIEIELKCLLENRAEILNSLESFGLQISCIYQFYDWGNDKNPGLAERHVDTAMSVGAEKILVVPGFLPVREAKKLKSLSTYQEISAYMQQNPMTRQMRDNLTELVEYAARQGKAGDHPLYITLEDFDGAQAPFARRDELRFFMEQVPGLKFTMDCGNFAFSDEDAWDGYELLKDYIVHVHCKDRGREKGLKFLKNKVNHGLAPVPAGGGYMPVARILEDLQRRGYEGYYAIEHFGAPNQLQFIQESAAYLLAASGQ